MPDWAAISAIVAAAALLGWLAWGRLSPDAVGQPGELWFGQLLLGLCLSGWLALLLAELGLFSWERLAILLLLAALALAWRQPLPRLALPRPRPRAVLAALPLLLWLPAAAWLAFRPHESIIGGADAGVYINLASQIAGHGSILIDDPDLADLPPALYPVLLRPLPSSEAAPYYLYPGFYVPGQPPGRIVPQFYPLYPVWQAVALGLGGVRAGLMTTGLWGLLGGLALFFLARRLFGQLFGLVALAGITLNGLQVWFSRYPTTETLTQALLWGGLWALLLWLEGERQERAWGLLAGLLLGQVMLARIDVYFVLAVPAFLLLWHLARRQVRRADGWFYLPLLALAAHSLLHAWTQSRPYFLNLFGYGLRLARRAWPAGLLLLLASLGGVLLLGQARARSGGARFSGARLAGARRCFLGAGVAVLLALAIYGWFFRPAGSAPLPIWQNWYAGTQVPFPDRENLVRLGWYLSPLGVWLGVLGSCLLLWRLERRTAPLLFVGLFFSLLYLWRLQNNPVHVYAMRRYVPAVVPFATLATTALLHALFRRRGPWPLLAGLLGAAWLAGLLLFAQGLVTQVDNAGIIAQLEQFNAQLPPRSLFIFYDPAPVGLGDFMGTPLRFLYGHTAFTLRDPGLLDQDGLEGLFRDRIKAWQAAGRAVYWVGDPAWLEAHQLAYRAQSVTLEAQALEGSLDHRPAALVERAWTLQLAQLQP